MLLSLLDNLSSIRLYIPQDLRTKENRKSTGTIQLLASFVSDAPVLVPCPCFCLVRGWLYSRGPHRSPAAPVELLCLLLVTPLVCVAHAIIASTCAAGAMLREAMRRFPDGIPKLDPVEVSQFCV